MAARPSSYLQRNPPHPSYPELRSVYAFKDNDAAPLTPPHMAVRLRTNDAGGVRQFNRPQATANDFYGQPWECSFWPRGSLRNGDTAWDDSSGFASRELPGPAPAI
jgi:hypothetical protein